MRRDAEVVIIVYHRRSAAVIAFTFTANIRAKNGVMSATICRVFTSTRRAAEKAGEAAEEGVEAEDLFE